MDSPVLLVAFNRPATTRRVFDAIRSARPARLFVAADGPRAGRADDVARCAQVREIVSAVDWDCQVETWLRDENAGCRRHVSEAISWFFGQVPEGIVLEDDCVPTASFFRFCSELLERYRDDERVFKISGTNLLGTYEVDSSYFFSIYGNIWGWASWRRAWDHYDVDLRLWPRAKREHVLDSVIMSPSERRSYSSSFDRTYRGAIDSWDYQWAFARFVNHGLTILPHVNLVQNVGFGGAATHARDASSPYADIPTAELAFPLRHPVFMVHDERFRDRIRALDRAHSGATVRGVLRAAALRALRRR